MSKLDNKLSNIGVAIILVCLFAIIIAITIRIIQWILF